MKAFVIKLLSGAVALPLFITILNGSTPVSAEQISRPKHLTAETNSAVTDFNLTIPVEATFSTDRGRTPSFKPSVRANSTVDRSAIGNRATKAKSPTVKRRLATNVLPSISVSNDRSPQVKSDRQRNKAIAVNTSLVLTKDNRRPKSTFKHDSARLSRASLGGNYIRLVRDPDKGTNNLGNPIYTLETYIDGELDRRFDAVSGTARSQKVDRNIGNNNAPLPDGTYNVSGWITPSNLREVDRTFISITPRFKTNRNDLGIHLDPSFNKPNGYDGTSGCIGLTTSADRDEINDFVTKYRPHRLLVKISSNEDRE